MKDENMDSKGTRDLIEEMLTEVRMLKRMLLGDEKDLGMIAQHKIMWRIHTYLLFTGGAALGTVCTLFVTKWIH